MRTRAISGEKPPEWPIPGQSAQPTRTRKQKALRLLKGSAIAVCIGVLLLVAVSGVAIWRLSATVTKYPGAHFNQGINGVWLEHSWAGEPHSDSEYDALAQQLTSEQIGFVFAHVGPLRSDGVIPDSLAPNAADFAGAMHQRMPGLRVLAWIGQVELAGGYDASQSVDLSNSQVRLNIAQTAAHFVTGSGFDGVHYDIEPITNNNPHFLDLLTTTRSLLPTGAILSTVGQKWAPNAHVADLLYSAKRAGAWWTSYYYAAVSAHVDQIVPMLYDSAMPTSGLYEFFVQQETEHILDAARSARTPPQVIFGLPTYSGDSFWFHERAENMRSGLVGVTRGLNSNRDTSAFTGVAIYRFGTTTQSDWATYDTLWLGK